MNESLNSTPHNDHNDDPLLRQAKLILPIVTHIIALAVYLIPLYNGGPDNGGNEAVLDEIHMFKEGFEDVRGTSPMLDLLRNDYWGRPMSGVDSHKSWRPFSVLFLRWVNSYGWSDSDHNVLKLVLKDDIFFHRFVSAMLHATTAECVSIVGCRLFARSRRRCGSKEEVEEVDGWVMLMLRTLMKLLFSLHPCHVEAVANVANRPHVLALLASMLSIDSQSHIFVVFLSLVVGFTCAETFIFQTPAIILSMVAVHWRQKYDLTWASLLRTAIDLRIRIGLVIILTASYLGGRYYYDTLDINTGLIRKAENAFFDFEGLERFLSFSWVTAIHIGKAFSFDPIGLSHEYGFDCVRKLSDFNDIRLIYPSSVALTFVIIGLASLYNGVSSSVDFTVFLSWVATLFPICGILKVGTFISDRLAFAASFAFCVYGSHAIIHTSRLFSRLKLFTPLIILYCIHLAKKVCLRTDEWTANLKLMESSLKTCPRSAKSNLEMSKIYSGLYPEKFNLTHAEMLIRRAGEIDPNFCDVHWQLTQLLIKKVQLNPYAFNISTQIEAEDHLSESILCKFTSNGAISLWNQYWNVQNGNHEKNFLMRRQKQMLYVNNRIREMKEEEEKRKSEEEAKLLQNSESSDRHGEL